MVRCILAIVLAASTASAHQPPAETPRPERPEPGRVPTLEAAQSQILAAYRSNPVADRVQIRLIGFESRDRRSSVLIYADAGKADLRRPSLRLDLGQLQIFAGDLSPTDRRLIAVNRFERSTYFPADLTGSPAEALATHFHAVPLPQLSLSFGTTDTIDQLSSLITSIRWDSIDAQTDAGRQVLVLKGTHGPNAAPLSLTVDRASGRLRRLAADLPTTKPGTRIELTMASIDPGEPRKWVLSPEGRTAVESPTLLTPKRTIAPDETVKNASLMRGDLTPVPIEAALPKDANNKPKGVGAILCVRAETDALPDAETLAAALAALAKASTDPAASRDGFAISGVALLGVSEFDPARLDAIEARYAKAAKDAAVPHELLFTSSRVLSVDRNGQPADIAIVLVNANLKVIQTFVVDGRSREADALAAEIILAAAPPPPAGPPPEAPTPPTSPQK